MFVLNVLEFLPSWLKRKLPILVWLFDIYVDDDQYFTVLDSDYWVKRKFESVVYFLILGTAHHNTYILVGNNCTMKCSAFCVFFSFCYSLYINLLKFCIRRMAHAILGQWLSLLVCLLILLKAESHPVEITFVQNAVAKGAGEKNQNRVFFYSFILPCQFLLNFSFILF